MLLFFRKKCHFLNELNIFKEVLVCMGLIFLIWGMALTTIFVLSDTVEDFLDAREERRHKRRQRERYWDLKD